MGLNYHFHNVLCINVLHHLYRKMCEVSNLSRRQKSPKGNTERQKKTFSNPAGAGRTPVGVRHGDSSVGAVLVAPFPMAQQHLLQLAPSCRGLAALDSPVTPVPELTEVAPTVTHPAPRGKSSDYPNTVIKGEMCF